MLNCSILEHVVVEWTHWFMLFVCCVLDGYIV